MPDQIGAMQAFVAVCDAHGFAAAARKLGIAPSAVTRLVASLEERLGVRLLQRTTRSVSQTDAGARFLARARHILSELEEAELSAQEERAHPRGRLVVSAPLIFGRMHVAPILSRLLELHADLQAELDLSDRSVNLVEDGVDVAIRIGRMSDSGLIARRLARTRRVLVASPHYLARAGTPQEPGDLQGHAMIAFHAMVPGRDWRFVDPHGGATLSVGLNPRFATNSGEAAIACAAGSGGITAALCYQVDAALKAGDLVEVLGRYGPPPVPIQAVFPASRLLSSKVRAFLTLAEAAARSWAFLQPDLSLS